MNKTCPSCGTSFNVSPQDEGKQFNCFKCNTPLTVTRSGLQAAGGNPPSSQPTILSGPVDEAAPVAPPRRGGPGPLSWLRNLADIPTCLFALGTFLIIWCLFSPEISVAEV